MADARCPVCQSPVSDADAACRTCGFNLHGATREFKPMPLDAEEIQGASSEEHDATLQVVRGPSAGTVYRLSGDEVSIGRTPQCAIFLNDMTVSRSHARLVREEGAYVIVDDNSFNGVWVNNRSVQSKALKSGDFIQIGTFSLLFEEE